MILWIPLCFYMPFIVRFARASFFRDDGEDITLLFDGSDGDGRVGDEATDIGDLNI